VIDSAYETELLEKVRANPSLYLSPGRSTDARDIALELVNDAVYLGASRASVEQFDGWFIVAAPLDWIVQGSKWSARDSFFRVQIFHVYRQNATRATILATAFCSDVVTFLDGLCEAIQGRESGLPLLSAHVTRFYPSGRVVSIRQATHEPDA
jgi:hypothetical protein